MKHLKLYEQFDLPKLDTPEDFKNYVIDNYTNLDKIELIGKHLLNFKLPQVEYLERVFGGEHGDSIMFDSFKKNQSISRIWHNSINFLIVDTSPLYGWLNYVTNYVMKKLGPLGFDNQEADFFIGDNSLRDELKKHFDTHPNDNYFKIKDLNELRHFCSRLYFILNRELNKKKKENRLTEFLMEYLNYEDYSESVKKRRKENINFHRKRIWF